MSDRQAEPAWRGLRSRNAYAFGREGGCLPKGDASFA